MVEFVTLSCPSCGGRLEVAQGVHTFACSYCGQQHKIIRQGGIITIEPIADVLGRVQEGVDKTASELAIKRLKEEIAELTVEWDKSVKELEARMTELHRKRYELATTTLQAAAWIALPLDLVLFGYSILAIGTEEAILVAIVAFFVLTLGIAIVNPKKRINRKRIAQIEEQIQTTDSKLQETRSEGERVLAAKQRELAYHERIVSRN